VTTALTRMPLGQALLEQSGLVVACALILFVVISILPH
jgi:hypothetical protein